MISFDEFKKVEITVGKILSAEKVPETEKLLKLRVDFGLKLPLNPALTKEGKEIPPPADGGLPLGKGEQDTPPNLPSEEGRKPERDIRQIVSGIAAYVPDPQTLVGKKCMFVTNLEPRTIRGLESDGMLFAVSTEDLPAHCAQAGARQAGGKFSLLEPNAEIPEGTRAR
jgi:tRNA-binding EMAP/Myf-like protein